MTELSLRVRKTTDLLATLSVEAGPHAHQADGHCEQRQSNLSRPGRAHFAGWGLGREKCVSRTTRVQTEMVESACKQGSGG